MCVLLLVEPTSPAWQSCHPGRTGIPNLLFPGIQVPFRNCLFWIKPFRNGLPVANLETTYCFLIIIEKYFSKSKNADRFISSRASNPFFPRFLRRRIKKVRSSFSWHLILADSKSRLSLNIFFDHDRQCRQENPETGENEIIKFINIPGKKTRKITAAIWTPPEGFWNTP